tara:strand:+ start:863 stop:1729 length:867 start_codon:yes stop_codon:yes gene_type:complete
MALSGFLLSFEIFWKIKNFKPIKNFKKTNIKLDVFENSILESLNRDGVAVTNIENFCPDLLDDLVRWKNEIKHNKRTSLIKDFLIYFIGGSYKSEKQQFEEINPLISFSIDKSLLNIINSYLGMWVNLIYLEMNETRTIDQSEPLKKSQNFHRDPGINSCIKVFIYLNDVKEGGGPFTYIKGSHRYGKYWKICKQRFFGAGGSYPDLNKLNEKINKNDIWEIYGDAGCVIIADTTGIHRGGNSFKKIRQMTTSLYYPPGDPLKSKIAYNFDIKSLELNECQHFALSKK